MNSCMYINIIKRKKNSHKEHKGREEHKEEFKGRCTKVMLDIFTIRYRTETSDLFFVIFVRNIQVINKRAYSCLRLLPTR